MDRARSAILTIAHVSKRFGGVLALNRMSVAVERGAIYGIIGPNGSGKTTLVNVITGFTRPDAGRVRLAERDITRLPPHSISRLGVARTFQTARPFRHLSAIESLIVPLFSPRSQRDAAHGRWGARRAVALDLLEEVGFERDSAIPTRAAAALPQGYLRRLELARCLAIQPQLIVTDELFSGLSPAEVGSILPLIEKLHLQGVTLILVEHRLRELFAIAQKVLVMHAGKKAFEGTPDAVARHSLVREIYLGVGS